MEMKVQVRASTLVLSADGTTQIDTLPDSESVLSGEPLH
jgi:hypothetical protein